MSALIGLALFLAMLGAPDIEGGEDYSVAFRTDGPEGIRGVACLSEWRAVEGNAQALCDGLPDRTIVLYPEFIPDRATLLDTLAHERCHFEVGVNGRGRTAWEKFNEAVCYAAGRAYTLRAMKETD